MNLFNKTNAIGKRGENVVKAYYEKRGCSVIDVSNDKHYQKLDIDLLINGQTVEVKTANKLDIYKTFCVELVSNDDAEYYKEGWFKTSQADIVIFVSLNEGLMYQMNLQELRQCYERHKDEYAVKRVINKEFDNVYKPSILSFIPIADAEAEISIYRTVKIED